VREHRVETVSDAKCAREAGDGRQDAMMDKRAASEA
jgi:hypothetical protein